MSMNAAANVYDFLARASDNWGAAGISATREYIYSSPVAGRVSRGVLTTIRLADAACDAESTVIITHNELTGALRIGHEDGKTYPVSVERAAALVEARINVWIARRELAAALKAAESAAFLAIHCDEEAA